MKPQRTNLKAYQIILTRKVTSAYKYTSPGSWCLILSISLDPVGGFFSMRIWDYSLFLFFGGYQSAHKEMAFKAPTAAPRNIVVIGVRSRRMVIIFG